MGDYVNIQKWMVDGLGLSGNELITFAIIYGFSKDGESKFRGSLKYICEWLGCSKRTAIRVLAELVERRLVEKDEEYVNGVRICHYFIDKKKVEGWCQNDTGGDKSGIGGGDKTSPNNIDIDNIYTPSIDKSILPPVHKEQKIEYADGVKLLPSEYTRLMGEYGEVDVKGMIQFLSDYKKEKGYKTKDDNLTIRRWVVSAYFERMNRPQSKEVGGTDYTGLHKKMMERYGITTGIDEQ